MKHSQKYLAWRAGKARLPAHKDIRGPTEKAVKRQEYEELRAITPEEVHVVW
jgi:hypothetical protein